MSDRVAVMNAGRIVQCDAPAAIYDRPRDLFVADFIGSSNLLEIKVLGETPDGLEVVVAGLALRLPRSAGAAGAGEAVVMIRPENLALSATAPTDRPAWPGRVAFALHAGPVMEYEVVVGETWRLHVSRPRIQTAGGRIWEVGDRVIVSFVDLDAVRVFPPRSG
jgi:spermidine/putrescine transport system ATP-binding protein